MKTIIFLFSGQARTSPFNINNSKRNIDILNSYNKYIFTEKFKSLYKYKIYISTDDLHLEDTINYFSKDNIGNIHLHDTNFYLKPVLNKLPNISFYMDKYNKNHDKNYAKYEGSIHQHYKILDCYNLLKNDNIELFNGDYIVRLRMDIQIKKDILNEISLFNENPLLQIILNWDFYAIGKFKIMDCYCSGLLNNYGNYKNELIVPDKLPIMGDYKLLNYKRWLYAPERQLFEMLFEYCNNNNLNINNSIFSLSNLSETIVRGAG
jgi:hypothetical protein